MLHMKRNGGNKEYQWIVPGEIPYLHGQRVILFGAGKGSEEFLEYLAGQQGDARILAVLDNDKLSGARPGRDLR